MRSLYFGYVRGLWEGVALPEPPPDTGTIICDGCGKALHGEDIVWSDTKKNVDFSPDCYAALATDKKAPLKQMTVYARCGLEPPAATDGAARTLL